MQLSDRSACKENVWDVESSECGCCLADEGSCSLAQKVERSNGKSGERKAVGVSKTNAMKNKPFNYSMKIASKTI